MAEVVVALGSNMGNRETNIRRAIGLIAPFVSLRAISPVYETEPMYLAEQPWFLNCVLVAETKTPPRELLGQLQRVEAGMGRQRDAPNGPRFIDIDIIFYDDLVVSEPDLVIPHPRVAERAFVLVPLADVRPGYVHPVLKKSVSALLAELRTDKVVRKQVAARAGDATPPRPPGPPEGSP